MMDLFDKIYFLKISFEILVERFRDKSQKNPIGGTDYQLQNILSWGKEIEEKVKKLGIEMIDAEQAPKQIFNHIKI